MRSTLRRRTLIGGTLAVLLLVTAASATQFRSYYRGNRLIENRPYDGRFSFVRVRYRAAAGGKVSVAVSTSGLVGSSDPSRSQSS